MLTFKYIILATALASTTLLYTLTTLIQPPTITLADAPHYSGNHVTLTATTHSITHTTTGATIATLTDPTNTTYTLTLYTTQPTTLSNGDIITATGTIDTYQNTYELTATTITIHHHNTTTPIPLTTIATHPTTYQDTTLTTTGIIQTTTHTTFTLKDPDHPTTITVYGATTIPPTGTHIQIHATLTYDPDTLRYTLHLTNTTITTITP